MPKVGKTRKQKKLADLRRKVVLDVTYSAPPTVTTTPIKDVDILRAPSQNNISTINYDYMRKDLTKTILLTGFIAAIEIVIRFTVKGI